MNSNRFPPLIKQGWMRALLLLFVSFVCSILVGIITTMLFLPSSIATKSPVNDELLLKLTTTSLFINAIVAIALTVMFRRVIDRKPAKSLGLHWSPFQGDAATGFCLGIALLGAGTLFLYATGNLEWTDAHFVATDFFQGLFLMALIAIMEELVFRGYILNNLMESMHKWAALGVSAAMFAIAHASNPGITSVAIVNLILAGLLLGINFIYTRNIWFAVFFHFSWNFVQGPVLGYTVSGLPLQGILQPALKGPWWLTGGTFGIEGSFISACLFVLALLFLYAMYEKNTDKTIKASQ